MCNWTLHAAWTPPVDRYKAQKLNTNTSHQHSKRHIVRNTFSPHVSFVELSDKSCSCIFNRILSHPRRLLCHEIHPPPQKTLTHSPAALSLSIHILRNTSDPHLIQMFWSTPHLVRARELQHSSSVTESQKKTKTQKNTHVSGWSCLDHLACPWALSVLSVVLILESCRQLKG